VSAHQDRLLAETDRQLEELRAACDGLATRAGLLITVVGIGATIVVARIDKSTHRTLLVLTLLAFGLAAGYGIFALVPGLKSGPSPVDQATWWDLQPPNSADLLHDSKLSLIWANIERWQAMRTLLGFQTGFTVVAIVLALVYAGWR